MTKRNLPSFKINLFMYLFCLTSAAIMIVVLTWVIVAFFYELFLIHIALSIGIFVLYGLAWTLSLTLAYRIIGNMRTGKFGSTPVQRKHIVTCILLLIVSITPVIVLVEPSWIPENMYPHLSFTGDPSTSMTVTWYSTDSYVGQVKYGTNPASMNLTLHDAGATNSHVLNFTGLTPNTTYYYSIDKFDKTWSFKTASNVANKLDFLAFSDVHSMFYPPMVPAMEAANPDFMIADGDLADYGASNADWQSFFNLLSPLATNYSMMTSIGNHDTMLVGDQNYLKYLSMPMASTGTDRYYHFKYNNVNFFCLELDWGMDTYDATQAAWFEQELSSVPSNEWIIVYDHCMHISSGSFGNATGNLFKLYNTVGDVMDYFHNIFVSHHVNLVISGHDHHFEISKWDGVIYTIVGTANTRLDDRSPTTNLNTIPGDYITGHSGFTEVQINGSNCTIIGHLYYDNNNTAMAPISYSFPI